LATPQLIEEGPELAPLEDVISLKFRGFMPLEKEFA
jgi:hypothetical protein